MSTPQNGLRRELALDMPAAHRGVRVARHLVRRFARMEGLSEEDLEPMALVVSELLANAIDHSAGPAALTEAEIQGGQRMHLTCVIENERWEILVSDEGGGDAAALQALFEADMPDLEDERGRGLFLMAQVVDAVAVEARDDGRGLTVRVSKRHGG